MKKSRIYTERDWRAADGLDRLYIHLLEPGRWELTMQEEERLDALRTVWKVITQKSRQRERLAVICEMLTVSERTAYKYIQDATALFGETLDIDHTLELRLAYERYLHIHDLAKKEEDWDNARRALDSAMTVRHEIEQRQPKRAKVYAAILFTNDPAALRPRNQEEGEEIDFDDINGSQSILEREAVELPAGH